MVEGCAVGRVVHYTDSEGECAAAMIVKVYGKETGLVALNVFRVNELPQSKTSVSFSMKCERGTWHWPEKA